ncbi:hypothetical protein [Duganella sp. LjRoot269]|uniref:hypothetical protein n=1 Tax=Duganella sp. LjRoot269 TaxID=3342305 RepID=UPI003ED06198
MMARLSKFLWSAIALLLERPVVADWLIRRAMRTPYSPIIKNGELYMERFWLFNAYPDTGESGADRSRWAFPISIRIHHILLRDQDRHLHDHPWNARTIVLRGWYAEDRPYAGEPLPPGLPVPEFKEHLRLAGHTAQIDFGQYHRITKLPPGGGGVWTMFITGRHRGTWGFDVDGAKVQWRKYLGLPEKTAVSASEDLQATVAKDHNTRRAVLIDIAVIYGALVTAMIWNWW